MSSILCRVEMEDGDGGQGGRGEDFCFVFKSVTKFNHQFFFLFGFLFGGAENGLTGDPEMAARGKL